MHHSNQSALDFASRIHALGFRVYLAKNGTGHYGFITDDTGDRVLDFSFSDGSSLGGNYGPPSRESGTGWRLEQTPTDLHTADDVRRALYAHPPAYCGKGWKHFTTLAAYLKFYNGSSHFVEIFE